MKNRHNESESEGKEGVVTMTREKVKIKSPKLYKLLLHNDDYTTMEFVVYILQNFFFKTVEDAQKIMLKVHREGVAICGIFTYEVAESKRAKVLQAAKENGYPLKCTMEEE